MELITKYFSEFTSGQMTQLAALDELYSTWNTKINVISRKDIDSLYEKHILHSLSIAAVFNFPAGTEIIDIGTGGGFPGIPLAIFFPDVQFHLVDSIAKKLKVVDDIAATIGLTNVSTEHTRAESIRNRKFDFAVSRAVAPLKDLWQWSKPLLRGTKSAGEEDRPSNGLICLKGGDLSLEIQESRTRPRIMEISEIFPEPYFTEKFMLYVPV
ncbi:MAG: 16S rRNA (guanine(527)-N(7))-methyltransferase RsmG [Terrimonas sp.]|nr:16S rRNA (guanine(527)-N(7))-methyltransferase RsmG [Terrimonas sp.]